MTLPGPLDLGVVIGRFQVPHLHKGHKKLIDMVFARHQRVLILLACPAWRGGMNDPLDYHTRKAMMLEAYPTATVEYINDRQTDEDWSHDVDRKIRELFPFGPATLYGGRDGFIRFYHGAFPTVETVEDPTIETETGTSLRERAAALPVSAEAFRAGVIYCAANIPKLPIMCVDAAIMRNQPNVGVQVVLIQKPGEKLWRFPGGHLDNSDSSLEAAVNREAREETGLEVGEPCYIGSDVGLPDWRAVKGGMAIGSALFYLPYVYGAPKGGDDAAHARWFKLADLTEADMEACHKKFLRFLHIWTEEHILWFDKKNGIISEISSTDL